uniref:UPF0496 protein 4 n=1 Tax=Anthurium amnicola TaxID=1678845 RepID=A0A1D1ZAA6_9ARAE
MPATDSQGSSTPLASLGRSILSIRRDRVHSMADPHAGSGAGAGAGSPLDHELESFQKHVADLLHDLAGEELLSLSWVRKLLDAFLASQEEFGAILLGNGGVVSRPPLDRMVADFFERGVKALDVCNAVRDGIERVRQWHKHLEIVLAALDPPHSRAVGVGQARRARKALTDLTISMLDDKEAAGSVIAHRNRSFGRSGDPCKDHRRHLGGQLRSHSWSVSRSWSAARQLQAIGSNLVAPRAHDVVATHGLAVPVYTMSTLLLFVMWALVAAIPCQDRGLQTHFSVPRGFLWAAPVASLHERIMEESKKRERRNSSGLLKEIHQIEKCSHHLAELTDPSCQYPLADERELEIREWVQELSQVCTSLGDGLDPLERQVREVFHRIIRSRADGLDCLGQAAA